MGWGGGDHPLPRFPLEQWPFGLSAAFLPCSARRSTIRASSGLRCRGARAQTKIPLLYIDLGSGTQTLSSGYDPADSPKLPRQDARGHGRVSSVLLGPRRGAMGRPRKRPESGGGPARVVPAGGRVCFKPSEQHSHPSSPATRHVTWSRKWCAAGAPSRSDGAAAQAVGVGWGTRAGRTRGGEGLLQTLQKTQLTRQEARNFITYTVCCQS